LATQASQPLFTTNTPAQQQHVMAQQQNVHKTYTEGHIYIAISDIKSKQIRSERLAAEVYSISQTTFQD
jgi:23S rRNA pseudoU1915 N3-methylase RlmH